MFRKPKRKAKSSRRRQDGDDDGDNKGGGDHDYPQQSKDDDDHNDDQHDEDTAGTLQILLSDARKRTKSSAANATSTAESSSSSNNKAIMHSYNVSSDQKISNAELATRTAQHHSKDVTIVDGKAERGADGIFRDQTRNKFAAGPIRAQTNVRVTARFDYQPDICKDYKDTGFCGYGDSCIYLHDRGDTLSGWQLEQQWEEQQKQKKQDQALQAFVDHHSAGSSGGNDKLKSSAAQVTTDDGLPFACHLCRKAFSDPVVVTNCNHYYCQDCILQHVRTVSEACPICGKDTSSVFNPPTKLLSKKRRLVGTKASWQEYLEAFTSSTNTSKDQDKL